MKAREISEHDSQVLLIDWWKWNHMRWRLPEFALFAVPNGGHRSKAVAGKLKAEGVRAGALDLILAVPLRVSGTMHEAGLFIEMKRKPNRPSKEQVEFMAFLRSQSYRCVVGWNFDEAKQAIEAYLGAPA